MLEIEKVNVSNSTGNLTKYNNRLRCSWEPSLQLFVTPKKEEKYNPIGKEWQLEAAISVVTEFLQHYLTPIIFRSQKNSNHPNHPTIQTIQPACLPPVSQERPAWPPPRWRRRWTWRRPQWGSRSAPADKSPFQWGGSQPPTHLCVCMYMYTQSEKMYIFMKN